MTTSARPDHEHDDVVPGLHTVDERYPPALKRVERLSLVLGLQGGYRAPLMLMAQNRDAERGCLIVQQDYETDCAAAALAGSSSRFSTSTGGPL